MASHFRSNRRVLSVESESGPFKIDCPFFRGNFSAHFRANRHFIQDMSEIARRIVGEIIAIQEAECDMVVKITIPGHPSIEAIASFRNERDALTDQQCYKGTVRFGDNTHVHQMCAYGPPLRSYHPNTAADVALKLILSRSPAAVPGASYSVWINGSPMRPIVRHANGASSTVAHDETCALIKERAGLLPLRIV